MEMVDIRQLMAGFLTLSMFIMLGNMIKRDHFDSAIVKVPGVTSVSYDVIKVSKQSLIKLSGGGKGPWKEHVDAVKPCWNKTSEKGWKQSKGFIVFSLTGGPEYHVSQIANAVVIGRHLGATVVLPDIIGNKPGEKRKFEEIYDVQKFVERLNGIIKITNSQSVEISSKKLLLVRVPSGVSEDYVTSKIEPLFNKKGNLKLVTYFPLSTTKNVERSSYMNPASCLAVFEALHLQPGLQQAADSVLESLRIRSVNPNNWFIAVDLRVDIFGPKRCQESGAHGRMSCHSAKTIGQFLKKISFPGNTTIYLTQNGWHNSLDALIKIFPNTYTKESLMPAEKVAMFLTPESSEFTKAIDYYICSQSEVFVPALSNLFYASVVGERIALGKTHILLPGQNNTANAVDYVSPYISNKSHSAYLCFC